MSSVTIERLDIPVMLSRWALATGQLTLGQLTPKELAAITCHIALDNGQNETRQSLLATVGFATAKAAEARIRLVGGLHSRSILGQRVVLDTTVNTQRRSI